MASSGVAHHSVAPAQGPLQILVGLVVGRQMRNLQTALSETGYPRMVVLAQSRVCAIFRDHVCVLNIVFNRELFNLIL